ncbi:MAG TPA: ABC transporter permease, partial [Aggregatilineales bacterium]|nr:ABC transporter permease [Aggregatilineales bacterium]
MSNNPSGLDFGKLLTIALKDVQVTFRDRAQVLIMIAAPLAITLIIAAAFSKFTSTPSNDLPVERPAIAVVNQDKGVSIFGQELNFGTIVTSILVPDSASSAGNGITKVLDARVLSHDDALAQVDQGKLAAAILIPPDFSASLDPTKPKPTQTKITFYQDAGSPIQASIAASIVRGVVSNVVAGDIADYVAQSQVAAGKASPLLLAQSQAIAQDVGTALQSAPPITLQTTTVSSGSQTATTGPGPLQYFAPAMAVFFLTFSMAGGAASILEEQDGWTLQRLLSSPTSRLTILAGKLFGTYLRGLVQLTILILATALMAPLMGSTDSVWGTNLPGIILVTLAATAAAVGL